MRYLGRWVWHAIWRSFGPGDFVASIVGNILAAIAHFYPKYQTAVNNIYWEIPLYALASAMLWRLAITPYELAQEATAVVPGVPRLSFREKRKESRQKILDDLRRHVVFNAHGLNRTHTKLYLDGHPQFHAIRKYLDPEFLKDLAADREADYVVGSNEALNPIERRFLAELERLEAKWKVGR